MKNIIICLFFLFIFFSCTDNSPEKEDNYENAIVYQSTDKDGWVIRITKDFKTSEKLTEGPFEVTPRWSSDKKFIYFMRGINGIRGQSIWRMDPDGKNKIQISPPNWNCEEVSPSFDGEKISFSSRKYYDKNNGRNEIYIMDINGENISLVTDKKYFPLEEYFWFGCTSLSRDSRYIAFSYSRYDTREPFGMGIYDLQTKSFSRYKHGEDSLGPTDCKWSPTRDELLFEGNSLRIYRIDKDFSNLVELVGSYNDAVCWSPDGEKILYAYRTQLQGVSSADFWIMNRDGSEKKLVMPYGKFSITSPCW